MCIRLAKGKPQPMPSACSHGAFLLVEVDPQLRRPVEDVEELSKREVGQRENRHDAVRLGEEAVIDAAHKVVEA